MCKRFLVMMVMVIMIIRIVKTKTIIIAAGSTDGTEPFDQH